MSARLVRAIAVSGGALVAVVGLGAVGGCSLHRNLFLSGLPGVGTSFHVSSVENRYGYLDVTLHGNGTTLRAFTPDSPTCHRILAPEAEVRFFAGGALGNFEGKGSGQCNAVGMGSLDDWRARRPRPGRLTSSPVPSAPAYYDVVYLDRDVVFLRGQFPLGSKIGWAGFDDTIAVVPNDPACQPVIRSGAATMEYRPAGNPVLALASTNGLCHIVGLIQPPAPAAA